METLILIAITGTLNVACFFIGAKVGQKVNKDEPLKLPTLNPIEAVREHIERKEAEMAQDRFDTIVRNIECYDGTGKGQEDVPRG